MAQLLVKSAIGEFFTYETIASGAGPIRAELETAPSFLCRTIDDDADIFSVAKRRWFFL